MSVPDSDPVLLRVPGWEVYPWLRAGFSTRQGGCSSVYGQQELNLGWTAEDSAANVARNRAAFATALGKHAPLALVTVRQVHSGLVRNLEQEAGSFMGDDGRAQLEGDGMVSRTPGRLLAILTADCVPVLVADTRTHAVGAFHAGWRGTLAHIVQTGVAEMQKQFGSQSEDMIAAIGPCIQACCFQVGEEVRTAFAGRSSDTAPLFSTRPDQSLHMDLAEANRQQLLKWVSPRPVSNRLDCARLAPAHPRAIDTSSAIGRRREERDAC